VISPVGPLGDGQRYFASELDFASAGWALRFGVAFRAGRRRGFCLPLPTLTIAMVTGRARQGGVAISEAASDIPVMDDSKPKRGRPPLIPPGYLHDLQRIDPRIHTVRGHQNKYLAHEAMEILGLMPKRGEPGLEIPPATKLVDWEGAERGRQGAIKWAALEQLGRMARAGFDHEDIRSTAAALERRPSTAKEMAASLRRLRLWACRQS
jgi:hypothetical protein